jgi:hypothetical protein
MRAEFARQMLSVISAKKVIINFDESIIQEYSNNFQSWQPPGISRSRHFKRVQSGM